MARILLLRKTCVTHLFKNMFEHVAWADVIATSDFHTAYVLQQVRYYNRLSFVLRDITKSKLDMMYDVTPTADDTRHNRQVQDRLLPPPRAHQPGLRARRGDEPLGRKVTR